MEFYGIRGVMHTLIKSYLQNRYQRVKFNNITTKMEQNQYRCPARISFGTLLLFIFINDLPSVIPCTLSNDNSSIILLTDDTSVIISDSCFMNFERNLNIVFTTMKKRFNSNLLSLNFDKTYYMQFITKLNV